MSTWADILSHEKQQPYFQQIMQFVQSERAAGITIYPPEQDVFNAFTLTELENVKVVILVKTLTTALIKHMVCVFRYYLMLKNPLH